MYKKALIILTLSLIFGVNTINAATSASVLSCLSLTEEKMTNIVFGSEGENVIQIQKFLYTYYGMSVTPTGIFDADTRSLLLKFQGEVGISGTGSLGPLTRREIIRRCGTVRGNGETAPNNCQVWYDGCNTCSRSNPGGEMVCSKVQCIQHATPYCKAFFSTSTVASFAPNITSLFGPTTIEQRARGTWTLNASITSNEPLYYTVKWGDENVVSRFISSILKFSVFPSSGQISLTHRYTRVGTYTVTFQVKTRTGAPVSRSLNVNVTEATIPTRGDLGVNPVCTADAKLCPDGSYVGRTGPNCEFAVCPRFDTILPSTSCRTPIGNVLVQNGGLALYSSFLAPEANTDNANVNRFKCYQGRWLRCDWAGTTCMVWKGEAFTIPLEPQMYFDARGNRVCKTPWGDKIVSNGEIVRSQPFFTGGIHSLGTVDMSYKCSEGNWKFCGTDPRNCN